MNGECALRATHVLRTCTKVVRPFSALEHDVAHVPLIVVKAAGFVLRNLLSLFRGTYCQRSSYVTTLRLPILDRRPRYPDL